MSKNPVDSIIRAQAVALSDVALSQVQISRQLNISKCCVQNTIKNTMKLVNTINCNEKTIQKRIQNRDIRHLKPLVKGDGRLSVDKVVSDSDASLPESVTTRTVRRYLRDLWFEYAVKIKK